MSQFNRTHFEEIAADSDSIRLALCRSLDLDESNESHIRSVENGLIVLQFLQELQEFTSKFFQRSNHLIGLFEREYVSLKEFYSRDFLMHTAFLESHLFPEQEAFLLDDLTLLPQHLTAIKDWLLALEQNHQLNQTFLRDLKELTVSEQQMSCPCLKCVGDYRSKLRDIAYTDSVAAITTTYNELQSELATLDCETIQARYTQLNDRIEANLKVVRKKLRRLSVNKLENQIKNILHSKFNLNTDLGRHYFDQLRTFWTDLLLAQSLSPNLFEERDYQEFFKSLHSNIWRNKSYLEREFAKFTKSILLLKRTDISSKILQEYLGQFWTHSRARTMKRKVIYHMGPTNSGKTYHALQALVQAKNGCYLAPLRLLAGELFDQLNAHEVKTTLLTGEEVITIEGATHFSSTIEMAKLDQVFECAVIDEIQMINDPQRGWAWTRAFINLMADELHICGDHTALELIYKIIEITGDTLEIKKYERLTELKTMDHPITLGELEKGDAVIVFSRRNALKYKSDIEKIGFKVSIIYGRLGPEVRREQARKFDEGETDILVSTDAIAMGMNLPIKRIVFTTLEKNIDEQEYQITESEIKQIAGRAGRYKRFPVGLVTCLNRVRSGIERINFAMQYELEQKREAMVGPDLEIFSQVNQALAEHSLTHLKLSEFLRLFNTMKFDYPFFCVDLKEMIEVTEMVEQANEKHQSLSASEIFGFACAPVNLGMVEHVQYFIYLLNNFIKGQPNKQDEIEHQTDDIEYLETAIKCVELYQWLARHFNNKNFDFNQTILLHNKGLAIEQLNLLLSEHTLRLCSSCGQNLQPESSFNICDACFRRRRAARQNPRPPRREGPAKSAAQERPRRRGGRSRSSRAHRERS